MGEGWNFDTRRHLAAKFIQVADAEQVPPRLPDPRSGLPGDTIPYYFPNGNPASVIPFFSDPAVAQGTVRQPIIDIFGD